jgi:hypothetical protein
LVTLLSFQKELGLILALFERIIMLPNDPYMLYSYINTKLRDEYDSLESLCLDLDISMDDIIEKLSNIGYSYNKELNKFM